MPRTLPLNVSSQVALSPARLTRVGVFLADGDYHTDWAAGAALWQSWSGLPVTVARYYAGTNYTFTTDLQEMVAAGAKIRISFTPAFNPPSAADLASITSLLGTLESRGVDVQATIWHEPFFNGLTAAQYQAAVAFYAPAMRVYCPFLPCLTGPDLSGANGNYLPVIAVDGIAVDVYPDNTYATGIMTAAGAYADANGIPLAVWEFGVSPGPNYFTGDSFGFSGGTTGNWSAAQNCTVAVAAVARPFGTVTGALAVTSTGGTAVAVSGSAVPGAGQMQACTSGDEIMLGAWVKTAVTGRTAEIHASFYTAGGVFISSLTAGTLTDSTTWQAMTGTVTAPATAAFYRVGVQWSSTVAAEVHYATVMWASDSTSTGFTKALGNSFFSLIQGIMAARVTAGKPVGDMIMFSAGLPGNTSATAILYPADYRVGAWLAMHAALDGIVIDAGGNGAGGGLGPTAAGETWSVTLISLKCSTSARESVASAFLDGALIGTTTWGSTGDSDTGITLAMAVGQLLTAQWKGADPGATGTLTVMGTRTV